MDKKEYSNIIKIISLELKKARIKHNYTIKELSEISNMSPTYLSNLENNKIKKPSLHTYLKLFDILEIPLTNLFSTIEKMPPFNRE